MQGGSAKTQTAKLQSAKYVAFLRGINLGRRNIKMDELKRAFVDLGFTSVQTVLASGNVIFASAPPPLEEKLQIALRQKFGFEISVVLRSVDFLQSLIDRQPFAKYQADRDKKFYVTFSSLPIGEALAGVSSIAGDFDLVEIGEKEFFCVAFRQDSGRFGAGLDVMEKIFRQQVITTRNWNTIAKILKKSNG